MSAGVAHALSLVCLAAGAGTFLVLWVVLAERAHRRRVAQAQARADRRAAEAVDELAAWLEAHP